MRAGEPEAYAELVRAHTAVALRAAVAFGARADAEDVVHSAFLKAYQAPGRFRDGAAFRPWLLRIVAGAKSPSGGVAGAKSLSSGVAGRPSAWEQDRGAAAPAPQAPEAAGADPATTTGWWWSLPGVAAGAAVALCRRPPAARLPRPPFGGSARHSNRAHAGNSWTTGGVRRRWGVRDGGTARSDGRRAGRAQALRSSGPARGRRSSGPPPPRGLR
ncbi:hypothetical protein GCM10010381_30370 [Streptomyces xantholiticus]|nr:hypothetical protein GCM10010381_30370 [Streptomyces xantholiticus]